MIVAGLRDMTVSVNGAQFLRSAHQSCTQRRVQAADRYIVFPECFVGGRDRHGDLCGFLRSDCRDCLAERPRARQPSPAAITKEKSMLYAILAYHVEAEVMSWTPEEDAAVMTGLLEVHDRLNANKLLGPSARLGATARPAPCAVRAPEW